MNTRPKLIMLVGISGSGKSTIARQFQEKGALWVSSDNIRKELYGSLLSDNIDNNEIFLRMRKDTVNALRNGQNVVVDSTNISQRRRISALKYFNKGCKEGFDKICIYIDMDKEISIQRQKERDIEEQVPVSSIKRQYNNLTPPEYFEGWDEIKIKKGDTIITKEKPIEKEIEEDWER